MALRYKITLKNPDIRPMKELCVAPKPREPVLVSFRKGGDYTPVLREIMIHPQSDLDAAVGSGKSTSFPRALARHARCLVVFVVANPRLVTHLFDYITADPQYISDGVESVLYSDTSTLDTSCRRARVVYMSSSELIAWFLENQNNRLSGAILYLDEAHEPDAYSYLLRHLGLHLGAQRVVRASATFSPVQFRRRETASQVELIEYDPAETPDTWDVRDVNKLWYYAQKHNTVVFIDSMTIAAALAKKYERCGCSVFRLTSDTSVQDFRATMKAMKDETRLVVVLADYSYRSGFTFDATTVLDTGVVYYMSGKPGHVEKAVRSIYAFEAEQAAGRVGRLEGLDATYARPRGTLETVRNDLDGVEIEAAALICRMLGFEPLPSLGNTIMGRFDIPPDVSIADALNGVYPLTYHVRGNQFRASRKRIEKEEDQKSVSGTTSEIPRTVSPSILNRLQQDADTYDKKQTFTISDGEYCMFDNTSAAILDSRSHLFPHGIESILDYISRCRSVTVAYSQLSSVDRPFFLAHLAQRYNSLCVNVNAMKAALQAVEERTGFKVVDRASRDLCVDILARVNTNISMRTNIYDHICNLAIYGVQVLPVSSLPRMMSERTAHYTDQLMVQVRSITRVTPEQYAQELTLDRLSINPLWELPDYRATPNYLDARVVDRISTEANASVGGNKIVRRRIRDTNQLEDPLPHKGFDIADCLEEHVPDDYKDSFPDTGEADGEVDFAEFGMIRYYPNSKTWIGIGPPPGMHGYVATPWELPTGHHIRKIASRLYPQLVPRVEVPRDPQ